MPIRLIEIYLKKKEKLIFIISEKALPLNVDGRFLFIFLLAISIGNLIFLKISDLSVRAAVEVPEVARPTTANVTVSGQIGKVNVECIPVNYTVGTGLWPGSDEYPKKTELCYVGNESIIIYLGNSTHPNNVDWNLTINASDMVDPTGTYSIPAEEIRVNSTCDGVTFQSTLINLTSDLQFICGGTADGAQIPWDQNATVSFYLDVPAGQYNTTYTGNFTIYVNSSEAYNNNESLFLPDNTTVTIVKYIEFSWKSNTVPVTFGTLRPGVQVLANATEPDYRGWPSNLTNGVSTNILVDYYIQGSDLVNTTMLTREFTIQSENLTYSNATNETNWPDGLRPLSESFYYPGGDFPNWMLFNSIGTYNQTPVWWNISIPAETPGGEYYGNVTAKAVDSGTAP